MASIFFTNHAYLENYPTKLFMLSWLAIRIKFEQDQIRGKKNKKMIKTIAFDADDTLWHNERIFISAKGKYTSLLSKYHDEKWVEDHLDAAEMRNIKHFGYGIKGLYEEVPVLHYNINLKRKLLNAFITYLVPIVVTLIMGSSLSLPLEKQKNVKALLKVWRHFSLFWFSLISI